MGCNYNAKKIVIIHNVFNLLRKLKKYKYILHVIITQASEGSSMGRFLAAELGVGLMKLNIHYGLLNNQDKNQIIKTGYVRKLDDVGCGVFDLFHCCSNEAGKTYFLDKLIPTVCEKIINDIL